MKFQEITNKKRASNGMKDSIIAVATKKLTKMAWTARPPKAAGGAPMVGDSTKMSGDKARPCRGSQGLVDGNNTVRINPDQLILEEKPETASKKSTKIKGGRKFRQTFKDITLPVK